jgi:hypothetical protein
MKSVSLLAAAALLGSATAKVHKLKLDKVSLSEQFVCRQSGCPGCTMENVAHIVYRKSAAWMIT